MNEPRWLRPTFFALVILFLLPPWVVNYIPTADGPAHVYNAWLIKELTRGADGLIAQVYQVDWRPHPNWLGHAVMAVLMLVVKPVIAEKLLFSLIIGLFLVGTWMLCSAIDVRSRVYAFGAFQFVYHQLLQTGFYNFSLSIGLYLLTLAVWWKRKSPPLLALLLILCYFSHPVSAVLALGSVGLLWLLTWRQRPLAHAIAVAPVIALMLWFVQQRGSSAVAQRWSARHLFDYIVQTEVLVTFTTMQMTFGKVLMLAYFVLAVATLLRRSQANAFGILTLVLLLLYVWSPSAFAGGQLVRERLVLYIYLLPLAWFTPRLPRGVRVAIASLFIAAAIAKGVFTVARYRYYGREVTQYVRSYKAIRPNTTVLPLLYWRDTPGAFTGVIGHASGYVAMEKRLVDLDNYEPATGYFPIAFRPEFTPPDIFAVEARPGEIDIRSYASRAEYVFTWKMPDDAPVVAGLNKSYRLVSSTTDAKLYERKAPSQFGTAENLRSILLPVAGTLRNIERPPGRFWRVEQSMRNESAKPVRVALNACPELPDCELDIAPSQSIGLSASPKDPPYILVQTRDADASSLSFKTEVERVEGERILTAAAIPAVRENEFRPRIVLRDVDLSPANRVNLRLWTRGGSKAVSVRAIAANGGHTDTTIVTDTAGFFIHGDLAAYLGKGAPRERVTLECEPVDKDGAAWAFVTVTENRTDLVTVRLP